jgi:hypothetical protein
MKHQTCCQQRQSILFCHIQNATKKINFLFRFAVTRKKKFLCIKFISIVTVSVIAVVVISVSIVMTRKSDTKATSTTTAEITTMVETSTTGSFKR